MADQVKITVSARATPTMFRPTLGAYLFSAVVLATPGWGQAPTQNSKVRPSAEQEFATQLGLPVPTGKAIEIRVWELVGLTDTNALYRFVESPTGFTGELYLWGGGTKDRTLDCASPLAQTNGGIVWCKGRAVPKELWQRVFQDLPMQNLWQLQEQQGSAGCWTFDGRIVAVDLLTASRQKSIWYHNPDRCCRPLAECKTVASVWERVSNLRRIP